MKRQVYLNLKNLEEARGIFSSRFADQRTSAEEVRVEDALHRVTAEPVFARFSAPSHHSAAMDGIAVRAESTYGTTERNPKVLKLGSDAAWINTGQPLPDRFDSVIMVEKVHQLDNDTLEIRSPSYPWQHVRKVGEDIVATQLLLPQNHEIRPYDMGALISAGVFSVLVRRRPLVAVIPTGTELLDHRMITSPQQLMPNRIVEYNSVVLSGLVRECGAVPVIHGIVPDTREEIGKAIEEAVASDADVVIINAGSSAGSKDYTVHLIREVGEVLVHGVAMMPGKPTILGVIRGKPVIGNPGYAVSAALSFQQFVRPLLYRMQGRRMGKPKRIPVHPSQDLPSKLGQEEFLRMNIGRVGDRMVATPLSRAAGSITSLTRAEGIVRIPALSEGISQDEVVEAELLVDEEEIERTVVIVGSHDITLDILADEVRRRGEEVRVVSGNVGSLGGIMALRKGTAHMAGSHLLDAETGEYNLSYVKRYLKGIEVSIFHLVLREQGLILPKGNPKGIRGIRDLGRDDVVFVNRQAGSGTRVLLDYQLRLAGMEPDVIKGYRHEEFTHMAVAVDVLSGVADCGMGIFAAAKALDLDFVPIIKEQYDLITPSRMLSVPGVQLILKTVESDPFRQRVRALGGYDPSKSGQLWTKIG